MVNAWKKPLSGVLIGSVTMAVFVATVSLIQPWLLNIDAALLQQQDYWESSCAMSDHGCELPQLGLGQVVMVAIISLVIAAVAGFLLLLVLRYQRKQALKISIAGLVSSCVIIGLSLLLLSMFDMVFDPVLELVAILLALVLAYWVPVMRAGNTVTSEK
jgi:hypothetical protein